MKSTCAPTIRALSAILRDFLESLGGDAVQEAAIACAGYCLDGTIINTNLPWTVSLDADPRVS